VDVHPLVRLGVREVLSTDFEVQEAAGREEALDLLRDIGDFDVAILDMGWRPNGNGASISGTETIRAMRRTAPVLGIVAHGDRPERHLANAALGAGASAYVARTAAPDQLRAAATAAAAQEGFVDAEVPPKGSRGSITNRQRQILQLLADGESTTVAARRLGLSEETIKTHM
jgi:DNA-binding NarL/FixJ family response regulator